jgi:peptide/nickel transport system permease protein
MRRQHPVLRYLLTRLASGVLALVIASILIFAAIQVLPGDVAQLVLGRNATPARVAAVDAQLRLDRPLPERYVVFVRDLSRGQLGTSTAGLVQGVRLPVADVIRAPIENSLLLAGVTLLLLIPLCLVLATVAAVRAGSKLDHAISSSSLAVSALPEFVVGTLLIVVLFSQLDLFPAVSTLQPGESLLGHPESLALPVLTLLLVSLAFGTRLLRASMIQVLRQDYVVMARLNGYGERRILLRYVLRNALAPSIQILAQQIQYLIGGIIVVESLFNYPGIGNALVRAISVRDVQEIMVISVLIAAFYILVNVLADIAVVLLVPRLRTRG